MKKVLLALLLSTSLAHAQQPKATNPVPVKITTGLTYQVLLAANGGRQALTIQNNNASDQCEIIVGGPWAAGDTTSTARTINGVSLTALQASIVLSAGTAYTRYYPIVPSDQILTTCATTGDSVYADTQ
jgi:hypothetical protein